MSHPIARLTIGTDHSYKRIQKVGFFSRNCCAISTLLEISTYQVEDLCIVWPLMVTVVTILDCFSLVQFPFTPLISILKVCVTFAIAEANLEDTEHLFSPFLSLGRLCQSCSCMPGMLVSSPNYSGLLCNYAGLFSFDVI